MLYLSCSGVTVDQGADLSETVNIFIFIIASDKQFIVNLTFVDNHGLPV